MLPTAGDQSLHRPFSSAKTGFRDLGPDVAGTLRSCGGNIDGNGPLVGEIDDVIPTTIEL